MSIQNHTMRDRYAAAQALPRNAMDKIAAIAADQTFDELRKAAEPRLKVPNDDRAENLVVNIFAFLIEANEIVEGDQL